jgi:hypothetical protein
MYKIISITRWGEPINLNNYDVFFIGEDYVLAYHKNTRFMTCFSAANCYTVITEKV